MEEKTWLCIKREFFEKVIAFMNHTTKPIEEPILVDKRKVRIVIDYDPQEPMVRFSYLEEDVCGQSVQESQSTH